MADINSMLYEIIGHRISELRKLNNDNQQQLADKIGLGRSSISNIEAGRQQISLHLLYRISQVYNSEIYSLIPKVSEVASKVSLEVNNVNEIFKKQGIGNVTQKQILELLK
jgi:transcriptional regulator with XRE-family HTH domain